MAKQILLPTAVKSEMVQTFKITRMTLDRALKYTIHSARSKVLRAAALQRGGVIYTGIIAPKGYLPDVETTFDQVRGIIHQTLGPRVELEISRETDRATLFIDGEMVTTFDNMTVAAWGNVLYSLQQIYYRLNS